MRTDTNKLFSFSLSEGLILICGSLLRLVYAFSTPFDIRSYDGTEHIAYINFVCTNWRIPQTSEGFEAYQAPLYYCLSAALAAVSGLCGVHSQQSLILLWRVEACALSIYLLAIAIQLGRKLFDEDQKEQRLWFSAIMAFFPCMVHHASRITNDSLFYIFAFLWMGRILDFYQHPQFKSFLKLVLCSSIGLLCKASMIPMTVLTFFFPLISRSLEWRKKLTWSLVGLALIFALSGWFYVPKALEFLGKSPERFIIANVQSHFSVDWYQPTVQGFLIFDPVEVIMVPGCKVSTLDPRRTYFWEYYFKSAYVGEFMTSLQQTQFSLETVIVRVLLLVSMLILPLLLWGLVRLARCTESKISPWLITLLFSLAGQIAYTARVGMPNVQDFRYFLFALPVYAYCIVEAAFSNSVLATIAKPTLGLWIFMMIALIIFQACSQNC